MLDFYRTRAGRTFFEATLPNLTRALVRLADSLAAPAQGIERNESNIGLVSREAARLGVEVARLQLLVEAMTNDGEVLDED